MVAPPHAQLKMSGSAWTTQVLIFGALAVADASVETESLRLRTPSTPTHQLLFMKSVTSVITTMMVMSTTTLAARHAKSKELLLVLTTTYGNVRQTVSTVMLNLLVLSFAAIHTLTLTILSLATDWNSLSPLPLLT